MPGPRRAQAFRVGDAAERTEGIDSADAVAPQTIELREEQLVASRELRDLGEIVVRTEVDEIPGRLEVAAYREEVVVEHEPVGEVVSERDKPHEQDGVLIIPIYEEQLVVTKRLVLRERMRVRRVSTTERQLFQDTLRTERLVVDDPQHTGLVREQYPVDEPSNRDPKSPHPTDSDDDRDEDRDDGGFLGNLVRRALE